MNHVFKGARWVDLDRRERRHTWVVRVSYIVGAGICVYLVWFALGVLGSV